MSYMKLVKLLYFADRKALLELGRPISNDLYVSMDRGPVLSTTYDLIVREQQPGGDERSYWRQHISTPDPNYDVGLLRDVPNDQLSPAEESILDEVFRRYGRMSRWQVVDEAHKLAEWKNPKGSSIPITIVDVLVSQGMSQEEARAVEEALSAEALADQIAR